MSQEDKVIEVIRHTDTNIQYSGADALNVSELFTNTIQGEGIHQGTPAVFFRLQGCIHNCVFCDTRQIWKNGNRFSFSELLELFKTYAYDNFDKLGAHLVVTGGAPLQQQKPLAKFLITLKRDYRVATGNDLYVEIENEAGVVPSPEMVDVVDCWNNSPKLKNSLVARQVRFNVKSLRKLNKLHNSWFKFVISKLTDWNEIEKEYLPLIDKSKILLMPMGTTDEELDKNMKVVQEMAQAKKVKAIDRLHIRLNKK